MLKLSNPVSLLEVPDWPYGRTRVPCVFEVENRPGMGERVARTTVGKPKKTTYYDRMRICEGDDGKTWILGHEVLTEAIVLIPGTLKGTEYFYVDDKEYWEYKEVLYGGE